MRIWKDVLLVFAGLMGTAGVALAAAGAHMGGDNVATAATFLLIHAAAITALALHGGSFLFMIAATLLALGSCLFSADLAARAFAGWRLFPMAAPAGGLGMIAGWVALSVAAAVSAITRP